MKKVWSNANSKLQRKRLYLSLLPTIRRVARKSGYAIGVHGSLTRDFDLIAVPWRKGAVSPVELAYRIDLAVCKYPYSRSTLKKQLTKKPYGRVAFAMVLGFHAPYIDLSVTARV